MYLEDCEVKGGEDAIWTSAWTKHGVVVGRASGRVDVIDVTEAQISQANSDTHTLGIVSMSPSVNDDLLLTSSMDGSVALWQWSDRALSRLARREHVRDVQVDGVAFNVDVWASALHPLGTNFAVAGEGAHVYLLSTDMATFGEGIRRLPVDDVEPNSYALSLAFNHEGDLLAMGTNTGTVYVWHVEEGTLLARIADHAEPIRTLSFSLPSSMYSDHLYVGSDDRTTTVHDVRAIRAKEATSAVTALQGHKGWILRVQAGGDGRVVATSSSDGMVRLWDIGASPVQCVMTVAQTTPIWTVSWRPEAAQASNDATATQLVVPGSQFVTGSDDGTMRLYRNAGAQAQNS